MALGHFVRLLEEASFSKSLAKSDHSDRLWPGKFLQVTEHVRYAIRYCKTSLLT